MDVRYWFSCRVEEVLRFIFYMFLDENMFGRGFAFCGDLICGLGSFVVLFVLIVFWELEGYLREVMFLVKLRGLGRVVWVLGLE